MRYWLLLADVLACTVPTGAANYRTFAQLTVDNTSGGVKIAASTIDPSGVPQMQHCMLRLETAEIRWTVDYATTVTTSVGTLMEPQEVLQIDSHADLAAFRAIRTGASSGTLDLSCWE